MILTLTLALTAPLAKPSMPPFLSVTWNAECLGIAQSFPSGVQGPQATVSPEDTGLPDVSHLSIHAEGETPYTIALTNLCDIAIELVDEACTADCPFDATLSPSESMEVELPVVPEREELIHQVSVFQGEEERTLTVASEGGFMEPEKERPLGCQTAQPFAPTFLLARRR